MDGRASLAGCLLASAWESGIRIPGLEGLRPRTRREAYGAQDAMASALEMPIVGWKVGAATPAIMAERGIEAPIPGPLYGPRSHASPATLPETEVELRVDGGARVRTYCGEWRRDPLDVMAWLVSSLGRRNIGLEAGAFVLTGSVTEPQEIVPGSSAVATFGGAARVLMRVGDEA